MAALSLRATTRQFSEIAPVAMHAARTEIKSAAFAVGPPLLQRVQSAVIERGIPIGAELRGILGFGGRLITTARSYGTEIRAPLDDKEFFNRKREIDNFKELLTSKPRLTVVSGPKNCGKSSLLLKVLEHESSESRRPILHIDLRMHSFSSVGDFVNTMSEELSSWKNTMRESAKKSKLTIKAPGISFELKEPDASKSPISRLKSVFQGMSRGLPEHSWWEGKQTPVLFIDEANKLQALLKDEYGHEALQTLFEWLTGNTKQNERFHVILASSDSFIHLWVNEYIDRIFFKCNVVGDLSKEESLKFWEERIIPSTPEGIDKPEFEEAYRICGGNMFLLTEYFADWKQNGGKLESRHFYHVATSLETLDRAWRRCAKDACPDSESEVLKVFLELTKAPGNFLSYRETVHRYGEPLIKKMISNNLIHLRPASGIRVTDIPEASSGESIITAESKASLEAMRIILKENGHEPSHQST